MRNVPLYIIKNVVCDYFQVPRDVIFTRTRKAIIVKPRQWYHYIACALTNKSLVDIGGYEDAGYDHTTVMHSRESIRNDIAIYKESKEIESDLLYMIKQLYNIYLPINRKFCVNLPLPSFTLKRAS